MSEVIIGSPSSGNKVLRRQSFQKDISGLETISEEYIIRTTDRALIVPDKDTRHSAFSTAQAKYQRMAVETSSTEEMDGGITTLNVTYVGLTSSTGLPPAVIRTIPATGMGIFGPPINIEVEFVSDISITEILAGKFSSLSQTVPSTGVKIIRIPSYINGTKMPENPRTPFTQEGVGQTTSTYYRYEGYIVNNIQATQRGQFIVATITFSEYAASISGASGGWANRFGNS
jgi:hypothetical protein